MTTETTALTVQVRAAVALGSSKAEVELVELAGKSKSITAITNNDGRHECHTAAMTVKEARINIEKAGKSAREDATAFSKAVISEEARLVALIKPEETRLIDLRDKWDAQVKAKKEAAEAAERQRVEAIKARIAEFGAMVADAAMLEAHGSEQELEVALAVEIDDSFGEFYDEAMTVKAAAVAKLREMVAVKTAAEAVAARIKAEQEAEATRLAAELREMVAVKTAAEAVAARIKAEQEAEATRLAAERERMAAERAEMDRIAAENRAAEAKRQAEERARLDAERAELDRQRKEIEAAQANSRREAREAAAKAESERLAALPKPEPVKQDHIEQPRAMVEPITTGKTIKLGEICARLDFTLSADFLESLGFIATVEKNARLYLEADFPAICRALVRHINDVATGTVRLAA